MGKSKFQISRSLDEKIRRIISGSGESDSEFSLVSSAYILGFNYGNVTNCVALTTNYQLHHAVFPVVGLAFFKESPTDDEIKAHLKSIKEYSSSPNGLGSFKSDKNEHLFIIYSVDNQTKEVDKRIFNFSKGAFVRRKRHRLNVLNDPYCPRNVYNGSEDVFNLGDGDSLSSADDDQVDHLIFFIHGVGGVCDVRFRSCVEVVADFKKMANVLLAQHSNPSSGTSTPTTNRHLASSLKKGFFRKLSTDSAASKSSDASDSARSQTSSPSPKVRAKKVECLPISWHSLTRRQTGFSEQMNLVALSSVPKLRHFLNKIVMDAMLYSSGPVYTQTIMNNVGNEINRLYTLFMERHPNFTGSVSLAGHSLGSVIVFDLLAHQIPTDESATSANIPSAENLTNNNNDNNNINNNNNNDNNFNNIHTFQKPPMNTREKCFNVAHNHRNILANDNRYCSDYHNLEELLKDMDLTQYAEVFHREHIDLNSLLLLTDLDMKELRLPLGARRKLGTYINFKQVCKVPMSTEDQQRQKENAQQATGDSDSQSANTAADNSNSNSNSNSKFCNPFGNMNTGQCLIQYPQLKFKPRCFFSFGSPTAMFLNVRGIQVLGEDYKLPTCDRMLNIYHPYDPLAYRFEPLIDPRFKGVEPVLIPHHRGGKRMHVQLREGFAKVGHDIKHRLLGSLRNTWTSFTRLTTANDLPPELSRSSSMVDETDIQTAAQTKRQKMSKSLSVERSSTELERESFETCTSNLSDTNSGQQQNAAASRKPLKRQKQILISQAEAATGLAVASGLSSIIETSMQEAPNTTESDSDPEAIVLDKLTTFKLDSATNINVGCSSEHDPTDDEGEGESATKNAFKRPPPVSNEGKSSTANDVEFDHTKIGRLNNGRRIDHVLQEKPIELFNEYIFAFTSHANYWQNEDSALIILNEIYQVDGVQLSEQAD